MAITDVVAAVVPARGRRSAAAGGAVLGLVVPLAAALIWELAAYLGLIPVRLLPPPSVVLSTLWDLAASGKLWQHIAITVQRVVLGFALGAAVATVLGVATGISPTFRRLFDPSFQALRNIPSIAWVPLFILWFGIFETPKVLLIAVGVFFPVYLTLAAAIGQVDRKLVEVGRVYRLSAFGLVRRILLPAALPTYVVGLRSGLGLGWMFVVAAEFMGASAGLGYLLVDGQMTGKPATIIGAIALFAVLGKLSDWALASAGAYAVRWQDGFEPGRTGR